MRIGYIYNLKKKKKRWERAAVQITTPIYDATFLIIIIIIIIYTNIFFLFYRRLPIFLSIYASSINCKNNNLKCMSFLFNLYLHAKSKFKILNTKALFKKSLEADKFYLIMKEKNLELFLLKRNEFY